MAYAHELGNKRMIVPLCLKKRATIFVCLRIKLILRFV